MQNNEISVLIPLYNHEQYIESCLQSVIVESESFDNIQIVVVDDCSRDQSLKLVNGFHKNLPDNVDLLLIKNENNIGVAETLNKGLAYCKHEYVALLASDDRLVNNSLKLRYDFLRQNASMLAVFTDANAIDDMNRQIHHESVIEKNGMNVESMKSGGTELLKQIILNWGVPGSTLMLRIRDDLPDFDSRYIVEDWPFFLNLASKNKIYFLSNRCTEYRTHQNNSASRLIAKKRQIVSQIKIGLDYIFIFSGNGKLYMFFRLIRLAIYYFYLNLKEFFS